MGLLAGGIAHDFNNLLMGVLGNADLALTMLSPENPAHDFVRTILDTGKKLADLTNQMLAFSGKGRFVVQPMDLNRIVRNLGDLLGMAVPKGVEIRYDLDPDLPRVEADASQLRQLVLNLVTNAGEAIGKLEGSIAVATGTVHASREFFRQTRLGKSLPEGEYVSFEVTDTGAGIEPDAMKKIFDPFFSTKFSGRGLGLAAVHGIVRSHNGAIRLESEPGQGSTFQVLFPPAARPASSTPVARKRGVFKGKGTVLVVDDEESVRSVAEKMLRNLGFDVLTAVDGVEGLETLRAHEPSITGVLLDLTMPRMDGKEAFVRIREILPDLPVLLMSGYNQQEVQARFAGAGLAGFLQKPFTLASLREILYAALDTPQ
jgi:CheY-like chemotaxis protein